MLEVGQVYNKNGYIFCVLDIIDYNYRKFALFSVEKNKVEYLFYEIIQSGNDYTLKLVSDNETNFALFEILENR